MMLNNTELRSRTSSNHIESCQAGLTLADIAEYVAISDLTQDTNDETTFESLDMYNGAWKLREGVYHIMFNESITLGQDYVAFIGPHENLVEVGATIYPRQYSNSIDSMFGAVLKVNNTIKVDHETPVGSMVIHKV